MNQCEIGQFIALRRKKLFYTQTYLAEKLGVSNKTVSKWENGKCLPDYSVIMELCQLLDISINDFFNCRNEKTIYEQTGLNPKISFGTYKNWGRNMLAYEKCMEMTNNNDKSEMLFLYGDKGCGKTILLQCSGNMAIKHGVRDIRYVNAREFVNEYIAAIKGGTIDDYRKSLYKLNFFILDDIQRLSGKQATQEEVVSVLNILSIRGCKIIISSDRSIEDLDLPIQILSKISFFEKVAMK